MEKVKYLDFLQNLKQSFHLYIRSLPIISIHFSVNVPFRPLLYDIKVIQLVDKSSFILHSCSG